MSAVADKIAEQWSGDSEVVDATETPANEPKAPTLKDRLIDTIKAGASDARDYLSECIEYIEAERAQKDAANDKAKKHTANVTARLNDITAKGWNKDAVKDALSFKSKSEKEQENYDITYKEVRAAIGHPIQTDLFLDNV